MKENVPNFQLNLEQFLYRFGYKVYEELKSLLRRQSVGVKIVIFRKEDMAVLLVCHRYKGREQWYLPGGSVQTGERPDEAIRREISEELVGLEIDRPELVGIYKGEGKKGSLTFLFSGYGRGEVRAKPGSEIERAEFFGPTNMPENLCPGVRERIGEIFEKFKEDMSALPEVIWGIW